MMLQKILVNTANEPPSPPPLNEASSVIVPLPLQSLRLSLGRTTQITQIFSLLLSTAFALVVFALLKFLAVPAWHSQLESFWVRILCRILIFK